MSTRAAELLCSLLNRIELWILVAIAKVILSKTHVKYERRRLATDVSDDESPNPKIFNCGATDPTLVDLYDGPGSHPRVEACLRTLEPPVTGNDLSISRGDLTTSAGEIHPLNGQPGPNVETCGEETSTSCGISGLEELWRLDAQREFDRKWRIDEDGEFHERLLPSLTYDNWCYEEDF